MNTLTEDHFIQTMDQLKALYPDPLENSIRKETPVINDEYRSLIEASPFVAIASIGAGGMDCSPRGDQPGFVRVLNETTVVIPDRRGNNRLDTLKNIVENPRVALLFLIPGLNETLRINGTARLTTDPNLLESMKVNERLPACAIVIHIETMYFQCARALKRSQLWNASNHVNKSDLPSAGSLLKSVIEAFDSNAYDEVLEERQAQTLY